VTPWTLNDKRHNAWSGYEGWGVEEVFGALFSYLYRWLFANSVPNVRIMEPPLACDMSSS